MKALCVFSLALLLTAGPATAGLDFTLQHKALAADGLSLDKPVHHRRGQQDLPHSAGQLAGQWRRRGSGLHPDTAGSSVLLGVYQGSKLLTIDQAGGEDLLAQLTAQLPGDAKNAKVVSFDLNPLSIFGWNTMEVTLRYDYFGQTLRRSLMYLRMLPGRVVQLTVVAPEADFDKVHKQARQVLSSWFRAEPRFAAGLAGGSTRQARPSGVKGLTHRTRRVATPPRSGKPKQVRGGLSGAVPDLLAHVPGFWPRHAQARSRKVRDRVGDRSRLKYWPVGESAGTRLKYGPP